jgi:hypothetical protein
MSTQVTYIGIQGLRGPQGEQGPAGIGGSRPIQFGVVSIDGTTPIQAGAKIAQVIIPSGLTVIGWKLAANILTDATVKVWKSGSPDSEVTGTSIPTLSNEKISSGVDLTGWDITLLENDVLYMEVITNTLATSLTLMLEVE